jgi:hypothetical protein
MREDFPTRNPGCRATERQHTNKSHRHRQREEEPVASLVCRRFGLWTMLESLGTLLFSKLAMERAINNCASEQIGIPKKRAERYPSSVSAPSITLAISPLSRGGLMTEAAGSLRQADRRLCAQSGRSPLNPRRRPPWSRMIPAHIVYDNCIFVL